jgi:predicted small lipoprotein YifL
MTYMAVILLSILMIGCGRKGPLEPLEKGSYPRTYPKPIPIKKD